MSKSKGPDTFSMKPSEAKDAFRVVSGTKRSIFAWGPPGIGKSDVIKQIAEEQDRPFIDLRLSQIEPTDLRGIPYPTEEEWNGKMVKGMRWSAPLVLPRDPDSRAIVALEEFNSAPQTVQAAAYQLILDRRLGEYIVPEGVMLIAAGNRETDKGITFKMPTPIANRFIHIEMKPDFEDWQVWALQRRVHKDVVGYLSAFKVDMFQFDPSTASRGFPTPRSWHAVSDILYAGEDMPDNIALALIAGSVGDGLAGKFFEYRKHANELPKTKDILSGALKKFGRKPEVSLCYALTTALCYELNEWALKIKSGGQKSLQGPERTEWLKQADNFLEFMMENFVAEICIMGAKTAIAVHRLPFDTQKMKHFDTFANQYKDYIMA